MKRIVVCCDGTWNNPRKPKQTNVSKLRDAILQRHAADGTAAQLVRYVSGVGSSGSLWDRLRGVAIGYGLDTNVQAAYQHIARDYRPGDDIYLFGFSRGAYTARSTLGMVRKCGIVKDTSDSAVRRAWEHYRNDIHPEDDVAKDWRRENALIVSGPGDYVPIAKFIGVWDTVGSLGVPIKRLRQQFNFHDVTLTSLVDNAFHALAIDERRKDYEPTLWARSKTPRKDQQLEQRWFGGAHSDVGGGAAREGQDAQSDYCLEWMLGKAVETGLEVDRSRIAWNRVQPGEFPKLHLDPGILFRIVEWLRGSLLRPIGKGVPEGKEGHGRPSFETVDDEARRRLTDDPAYRPTNLMVWELEQV
ncbi:MAG TPA: DUF2235 domain-containing protein [Dehalococcoidia bacterium]|nr:DUF2235 domain-containing protein [Dehalococcoidia bacterium]